MDFNAFMGKVKSVTAVPSSFLEEKLSNAIKFADPQTQKTFFRGQTMAPFVSYVENDFSKVLHSLSTTYICYLIARVPAFGFNNTINNTLVELELTKWFKANSSVVGQSLLVDYLMKPELLGPVLNDDNFQIKNISDKVATDEFITALLLECDTLGSNFPAKSLLLMLKILDKGGVQYSRVASVWNKNERWNEIENFDTVGWLDTYENSLRDGKIFSDLFPAVQSAASKADRPIRHGLPQSSGPMSTSPFSGEPPVYQKIVYGSALVRWIQQVKTYTEFPSGKSPQNVSDTKISGGCVLSGSMLTLLDGSEIAIESISAGEALLSSNGKGAFSTGEILANPNITEVYSINEDEPFMSFDHLMMTQRGWCSLAPTLSHQITPHLEIGTLAVGDVVWKVENVENKIVKYEKIVVERINIREIAPDESVIGYVLHQRGHHVNHVNGYCCHSGYPEISMQWLTGNTSSKMTSREQLDFSRELERLSPQFEKALGKGMTDLVIASLKNSRIISAQADHTDQNGNVKPNHRAAKNIILPSMKLSHIGGDESITNSIKDLGLYQGHCFINGAITDSDSSDENIYWSRDLNGETEYGVIQMSSHGLRGIGRVTRGDVTATFAAEGFVSYDIFIDQKKWLRFSMGFAKDDQGNSFKKGFVEDYSSEDNSATLQNNSTVLFSIVDDKKSIEVLHVDISFKSVLAAFEIIPYIETSFSFSNDYQSFAGVAYKYDKSASSKGYKGEEVKLIGKLSDSTQADVMKEQVTRKLMSLPIQKDFLHQQSKSIRSEIESSNPAFVSDNLPLDAYSLYSLPMPDLTNVHEVGFSKLKDLMMYALSKSNPDRLAFFGQTAPSVGRGGDLTQGEADLLKDQKISDFLVDKFAIGYLTQAFSKSSEEKIKAKFDALSNVDEKLSYFWKGDGEQSFAKDPGYSNSTSKINDTVYASQVPGLEKYMGSDSADWAKKLYEYCTKKEVLTGLSITAGFGQRKRLTHLSSMLQALDPKGRLVKKPNAFLINSENQKAVSYSTALFEEVLGENLKNFTKNATLADEDEFNAYLTEYFKQYFAKIVDSSSNMSAEVRRAAQKELDELMKLTGAENSDALVAHLNVVIKNSVSFLLSTKNGPIGKRINDWAKGFSKKNPKLGKLGSVLSGALTMGTYGFGMFQVISVFRNFDTLDPQQKVSIVASTLDLTSSMFGDYSSWVAARKLSSELSSLDEVLNAVSALDAVTEGAEFLDVLNAVALEEDLLMDVFESPAIAQAAEELSGAINKAESLGVISAKWAKISAVGEVVSRSFSVVALAAGAVVTGFQIANDFATNQPASIKALDIVTEITTAISFTIELGSGIAFIAGQEIAASIPIIGAVLAVIGIIVSIVLLFIKRNPPPSPIEIFIDEQCVPFINNLPMPPQSWIDSQKKIIQHLTGDKTIKSLSPLLVF